MNPNTIVSTGFLLPTTVIANGSVTGNEFSNPNNILLVDGDLASSNVGAGVASDITIGNFNTNLPQNAVVVGVEMQLIAKRGAQTSPQITLTPYLFDNTNGADDFYPYVTPFTGLTEDLDSYVLGTQTYLFASSFDVDQINNLKMNIVANGDVQIDSFLVNIYYYEQEAGTPITPSEGNCEDCNSVIQVPEMFLQLPFLVGQTKFYLQPGSLQYANGQPVQPGDVGECGGEINFVFDEGKIKAEGQNFEENVRLDVETGSWEVLSSGVIEVDITDVENRGIEPYTPYGHNANLMSDHDANSKVVISNSGRFYSRFVKRCEEGTTFSAPIEVLQEEAQIAYPVTKFNFKGNGVSAVQNGIDPEQVDITIAGNGTSTPVIDSVESVTSGSTQVDEFSWEHTCSGVNRYLLVQFSLEEGQSVSSLTYDGVAMSLLESQSGASNTRTEIWGLVAPSVGTNDIEVTFSGLTYFSGGSVSSANVDQSTPIGDANSATGTSLTPSVAITTDYDNSIIFDVVSTAQTPILITPGAGQVSNWSEFANTDTRQGAGSYELAGSSPDAITISYSITQNTEWSISAVELKGITTGNTSSNLEVEDEGVSIDTAVTKMNFVGAGVVVTQTAPSEVEIEIPGSTPGSDELVAVSATDTTPGFLDDKITIISSDASVTVTKTINNPAGNEEIEYDLTVVGGGGNNTISNLNAGEDIDGVTEPKAVFLGSSVTKTPACDDTVSTDLTLGWYDVTEPTFIGVTQISANNTRRASPFTTPAHDTTVNTIILSQVEGISASSLTLLEAGIYTDNAGEPGTLVVNATNLTAITANNNYKYTINLGDTAILSPSTTYWVVVEFDNGTTLAFNNTSATGGSQFIGGVWVSSDRFRIIVGLLPFIGDVYQSFYSSASGEPREAFLGFTTQNVTLDDPISVIHDGVVDGFTGLTPANTQYVSTGTPGEIQTSATDTVKIGTATKATEIIINRVSTYQ